MAGRRPAPNSVHPETPAAGPSSVWSLVYYSSAVRKIADDDLRNLLRSARGRNGRVGVTGILVHWDHTFFQVLEGPQDSVRTIFEDFILPATLHRGVIVAFDGRVSARSFSGWRMAAATLTRDDQIETLEGALGDLARSDHSRGQDTIPTVLLKSFLRNSCMLSID